MWSLKKPMELRVFESRKGQAILIDFAIATMMFLIIFSFLLSQFDFRISQESRNSSVETMKLKAEYVLEALVKSPGVPENWDSANTPLSGITRLGLAVDDRLLSESKLADFNSLSSDYALLKQKLGIEEYDFFFSFTGIDSVNAGLLPAGNATEVRAARLVTYKGGVGVAELRLYTLE